MDLEFRCHKVPRTCATLPLTTEPLKKILIVELCFGLFKRRTSFATCSSTRPHTHDHTHTTTHTRPHTHTPVECTHVF